MIKINEKLKDNPVISKQTLPMLFEPSEEFIGQYEQIREFAITFDNDSNFIVETTLSSSKEIKDEILKYLSKRKALVLQGIEMFNKELSAIKEILGE